MQIVPEFDDPKMIESVPISAHGRNSRNGKHIQTSILDLKSTPFVTQGRSPYPSRNLAPTGQIYLSHRPDSSQILSLKIPMNDDHLYRTLATDQYQSILRAWTEYPRLMRTDIIPKDTVVLPRLLWVPATPRVGRHRDLFPDENSLLIMKNR